MPSETTVAEVVGTAFVAVSFVVAGLLARSRAGANPMGGLMIATGLCLVGSLVQGAPFPALSPLGVASGTAAGVLLGFLILAFPSGHLDTPSHRLFVAAAAVLIAATNVARLVATGPMNGVANPYQLIRDAETARLIITVEQAVTIGVLVGFLVLFLQRWAGAPRATSRVLAPVLVPALLLVVVLLVSVVAEAANLGRDVTAGIAVVGILARAGVPIGFLVGLLRTLALENEQLRAEVAGQLDEVRASRARVIEAGDAERRRVERDLHDGAQQRLVALSLDLDEARRKLGPDVGAEARRSLEQASRNADDALRELRDLARGIHPLVLTQAGLGPAVTSLARRSGVQVALDVAPGRYDPSLETTVYFLVSEALANMAKHAHASRAEVRVAWDDGYLTVHVVDDGVGGADPAAGSGLQGLRDRLAAVEGTLDVASLPSEGTRLTAKIPSPAPSLPPAT